jgi:hypothetical protein
MWSVWELFDCTLYWTREHELVATYPMWTTLGVNLCLCNELLETNFLDFWASYIHCTDEG